MKFEKYFAKISVLLIFCGFICTDAIAGIIFLPRGGADNGGFRAAINNSCSDYTLKSPKCAGKKCEQGWICDTCTNSSGTYYNCNPKVTPIGYIAGLTMCEPCNEYIHNGFSGDLINGRCVPIKDCSQYGNDEDYIPFQYVIGVEVGDFDITYIERTGYKSKY